MEKLICRNNTSLVKSCYIYFFFFTFQIVCVYIQPYSFTYRTAVSFKQLDFLLLPPIIHVVKCYYVSVYIQMYIIILFHYSISKLPCPSPYATYIRPFQLYQLQFYSYVMMVQHLNDLYRTSHALNCISSSYKKV